MLFTHLLTNSTILLPEDHARVLSLLASIVSEKDQTDVAEEMFTEAIKISAGQTTFQKADSFKYYALFLDSFEGRDEEVSVNVVKAKEVLHDLALWSPKLMHIVLRDLEY
jgi:hypothetical protein